MKSLRLMEERNLVGFGVEARERSRMLGMPPFLGGVSPEGPFLDVGIVWPSPVSREIGLLSRSLWEDASSGVITSTCLDSGSTACWEEDVTVLSDDVSSS